MPNADYGRSRPSHHRHPLWTGRAQLCASGAMRCYKAVRRQLLRLAPHLKAVTMGVLDPRQYLQDSLAEWSKALASGASP